MAKFRMVHTEFWDDPKVVEEMTPEDKYFFLYLLTNSNTTQIGIYQITKKQMAFDIGHSIESVNAVLERFIKHHKIVLYNTETREIAIKNWGKYNLNRGGKPVLDCVKTELKTVKDISLIQFVGERIEKEEIKKLYESYYVSYDESSKKEESSNSKGSDDTSTIGGQEEEKEEQQQEEKEEEEQQQEEKEEEEQQHQKKDIVVAADFYQQNFGVLNLYIGQCITEWENDLGSELVIEAMQRTLKNGKKWNYTEGILRGWADQKLRTIDDVHASDVEFEARNKKNRFSKPVRSEQQPTWLGKEDPVEEKKSDLTPEEIAEFEKEKERLFNRIKDYKEHKSG